MRLRKKPLVLVVAIMASIVVSSLAYAWIVEDEGNRAKAQEEALPSVTRFEAVINGMRSMDVFVCVNISSARYVLSQTSKRMRV